MSVWLQWLLAAAILVSLPWLIGWGKRHARGSAGGVAMLIGLAFGHLFDPAGAQATEAVIKRKEQREEAEAGEGSTRPRPTPHAEAQPALAFGVLTPIDCRYFRTLRAA
jgi:hypothetical protein